jgi:hypothetical protein
VAIALHLTTGNGFPAHLLVYIAAVTVVAVHDRTRSQPRSAPRLKPRCQLGNLKLADRPHD